MFDVRMSTNNMGKTLDNGGRSDQLERLVGAMGRNLIPVRESALFIVDPDKENTPERQSLIKEIVNHG